LLQLKVGECCQIQHLVCIVLAACKMYQVHKQFWYQSLQNDNAAHSFVWCENWCEALRKECRLRVLRTCGIRREEEAEDWRKPHKEELQSTLQGSSNGTWLCETISYFWTLSITLIYNEAWCSGSRLCFLLQMKTCRQKQSQFPKCHKNQKAPLAPLTLSIILSFKTYGIYKDGSSSPEHWSTANCWNV
jgi:hypothetical protein